MKIVHESYLYLILFPVFDGVGLNQNSIFIYYFSGHLFNNYGLAVEILY